VENVTELNYKMTVKEEWLKEQREPEGEPISQ